MNAKRVSKAEIETKAILRDVVAAIAATLGPSAMVGVPMSSAILLPCGLPLPTAMLSPTTLLLPRLRLLLGALGRDVASLLSRGAALLCGLLALSTLRLGLLLRLLSVLFLLLPLLRLRLLLRLLSVLFLLLPLLRLRLLLRLLSVLFLLLPLLRLRLLLRLLSVLFLLLPLLRLRLLLRLLSVLFLLLPLLRLLLGMLLLLLLFRLALVLVPPFLLPVNLYNSSGKRNQRDQTHNSKKVHIGSPTDGQLDVCLATIASERAITHPPVSRLPPSRFHIVLESAPPTGPSCRR